MKEIDGCLLIGGEGELRDKFKKIIINSGLEKKVFLLGKIQEKDLGSYYQTCDIFCLPSVEKSEAFGLVLLEAMHFGKPLVSTDIKGSGVSWVNQNNITGLVVEPKDPTVLAGAINKIIENPNLKIKFGENGKRRFKKEFEIKTVADKIFKLYNEVRQ